MSIRLKALCIILVTVFALMIFILLTTRALIEPRYHQLEEQIAYASITYAVNLMDTLASAGDSSETDWWRQVDDKLIDTLSDMTSTRLMVRPWAEATPPSDFLSILPLLEDSQITVRVLSEESIAAYALIRDGEGSPALVMRMVMPRTINQQWQRNVAELARTMVPVTLVFIALLWLFIDRLILVRFIGLRHQLSASARADHSGRFVALRGRDEIAHLASEVNTLLASLRQHKALLHQSRQQFTLIQVGAPVILFALNMTGTFNLLSGRMLPDLGFPPDSALSFTVYDSQVRARIPWIVEMFEEARRGETVEAEVRLDGHTFMVRCAPQRDADGDITGVFGVATLISPSSHADRT